MLQSYVCLERSFGLNVVRFFANKTIRFGRCGDGDRRSLSPLEMVKKKRFFNLISKQVDKYFQWKLGTHESIDSARLKFEQLKKEGYYLYRLVNREEMLEELELEELKNGPE